MMQKMIHYVIKNFANTEIVEIACSHLKTCKALKHDCKNCQALKAFETEAEAQNEGDSK